MSGICGRMVLFGDGDNFCQVTYLRKVEIWHDYIFILGLRGRERVSYSYVSLPY